MVGSKRLKSTGCRKKRGTAYTLFVESGDTEPIPIGLGVEMGMGMEMQTSALVDLGDLQPDFDVLTSGSVADYGGQRDVSVMNHTVESIFLGPRHTSAFDTFSNSSSSESTAGSVSHSDRGGSSSPLTLTAGSGYDGGHHVGGGIGAAVAGGSNDGSASHGSSVPFRDWRHIIVGSDSPLSVGSTVDSDDGSASHGSSVQLRDWQQKMAGSDSPFSFGSDDSSSSHGFGSGLSPDLGDLFTGSNISRDAFQGTQFPEKVHFTQSHNNTVAPLEFDGVDGAGLPASDVLKMLEVITAERSGTNYN